MPEITEKSFHHEFLAFAKRDGAAKTTPSKMFVMIRPGRPFDPEAHRYAGDGAGHKGNTAMRAWFAYLAAKGLIRTFNTWRAILKSGHSIGVVCADPAIFDMEFVPPGTPVLPPEFWDEFDGSRISVDRRYDPPEERERIIEGFNRLRRGLRSGDGHPRVSGWSTLGDAVKPLREWGQ